MAGITKREKIASQTLYQIGYKYLCDNFHKFKTAQKIKIALDVLHIFDKDDGKTDTSPKFDITVKVDNGNLTPQESGNRISEYVKV